MRIQHNIMAMSAYRNYTNNVSAMKKNLEKLSSGYKINRAGDDAAGLAISEKMRAQITGLETAQKNAKDGISLVQTAEGALTEVHDMLNRMVELATMSANGTYDNDTDRAQLQKEMDQLKSEINRIADSSNFNGIKLLDGSMSDDTTGVVTVGAYGGNKAAGTTYADASGIATWASATADNVQATAAVGKYVLHASATQAQAGKFTVDLSALKLESDGTNKAAIKLNIGEGSATFEAADSKVGTTLTGADIATKLASDYVFVVTATGAGKLVKASTTDAIAAGDLVYKAKAGTGANTGFVTFEAKAIAAKTTTGTAVTAADATAGTALKLTAASGSNAATVPAQLTDDQGKDFNLKMAVTAAKVSDAGGTASANTLYGWNNLGVTESQNTMKAGDVNFGNTTITVAASKITEGMKMTIGAGSKTQTAVFKVSATATTAAASDEVLIDLSKLDTVNDAAVASAIANAFNDPAKTGGVVVGADGTNVTLSEYVNATTRTSLANADVQKAMSSAATFKDLVKFTKPTATAAVPGTKTLTVDTNKIYANNALKISDGTGSTAKSTEYVFVTDKTGKTDSSTTKYVLMDGSNTAQNLAAAIAGTGTNPTAVAGSDGKVTITYTDTLATGTTPAVTVSGVTAELTGKKGLTLQIGDTADSYNKLTVQIKDMHTDAIGMKLGTDGKAVTGVDNPSIDDISIADQDSAAVAVDVIKRAINQVSDLRGTLGATQNRLDHTINNLSVMTENIQDAESTIRDVDVAEEMMAYTKNNILIQSAQAMLAQANQVPQGVLQLLQ